jgi:hypothetical protein
VVVCESFWLVPSGHERVSSGGAVNRGARLVPKADAPRAEATAGFTPANVCADALHVYIVFALVVTPLAAALVGRETVGTPSPGAVRRWPVHLRQMRT